MMAELPSKEELIICLLNNDISELYKIPDLKNKLFGKSGKNLLHLAAKYSTNPSTLQLIVYKSRTMASKFTIQKKRLAIHIACKHGNLEAVQTLLKIRPNCLNQKDFLGYSPLAVACKYRQLETCSLLVMKGADICTKSKQCLSPLQICSASQDFETLELLISNIDCQTWADVKINCLVLALGTGNSEFVSFLLTKCMFKETCIFTSLVTVLKACKTVEMMKVVLEFIKDKKIAKLLIMLEIEADSGLILEYCENELQGVNSLKIAALYDRDDLMQGLYQKRLVKAEEILEMPWESLREKCRNFTLMFRRWQQTKGVIFIKKYCKKGCISRLPPSLIRQLLAYI